MAGPLNLLPTYTSWQSGNIERRNRWTNQHGASGQNKTPGTLAGTNRIFDDTSHWNYEPALDLLPAIHEGEMHAAMQNAARTFTEARGLAEPRAECQRILPWPGSCRSSGNREQWQNRAERCQDWKIGKKAKTRTPA